MPKNKKKITWKKITVIIASVILLFSLISMIAVKFIYDSQFPRYERHDETISAGLRYSDYAEEYPRRLFSFQSGDNTLQGYLYGEDNDQGLVVVAHGIGGGADSYLPQILSFVRQGWQVLAYDATGSFDSEGKSTRGFPQSLLDLDAAMQYIESQPELSALPLLLFGHSWGGYAVAAILHYDYDIRGVVTVSAADGAMAIISEQGRRMMGFFIDVQYPFLWLYQRLLFGDAVDLKASEAINSTDIPVMVIHGTEDEMINYDDSAIIAHKDEIRTENTVFISADSPGRNGHNSLFRSQNAIDYIDEVNKEYRQLYDEHNQNIPYAINQEFYASIDREQAQELDPNLMAEINRFLLSCIE